MMIKVFFSVLAVYFFAGPLKTRLGLLALLGVSDSGNLGTWDMQEKKFSRRSSDTLGALDRSADF